MTIDAMARDAIALIHALGFEKVDLLGFSLGGFVAQDIVLKAPGLVRRLILTGTGPAGGKGIDQVGAVSWPLMVKGLLTLRDPKTYLFFTSTANGRQAAKAFLQRLKERKANRDKEPTPRAFLRQLKAIKAWGRQAPQALGGIRIPVLIANGDNDIMVPTVNRMTWRAALLAHNWSSTRTPGTAGSSSTTASSCPKRWPSSMTEQSKL